MANKTKQKQTKQKSEPKEELKELLQRTQANFENYRKQQEKRIEDIREMASKEIILQLLPILDNFELALKSDNSQNTPQFIKGVELIYSQFFSIIEEKGIEVIQTENKKFDPYFHEALMKVESDKPENTIVEVLQKGYLLNGKVIRHAKVKVSSGKGVLKENKNSKKTNGESSGRVKDSESIN